MIEFGFNEEQEMFRQEVRSCIKKEIAPLVRDNKVVEQLIKADKFLKLGSLNYPERIGGWTLDFVSTGILVEELYMSGSTTLGYFPFESTFNGRDLMKLPEEVQDEIGPSLMNRAVTLRHAYTEADSGNEQAAIRTRAVREGDYYIINGEKQPATGSGGATYSVVTAVTDPEAGLKGISQFLVPRNTPGVSSSLLDVPSASERKPKSGVSNPETDPYAAFGCVMNYDNVKIPAKYRLGEEGEGLGFLESQHSMAALLGLSMNAVAYARLTLNEIIEFAGQRVHFGQPIVQFQGVSFPIAEYYHKLEAARLLIYRALYLMDQGCASSSDVAMAKLNSVEVSEKAMLDFMRIAGYPAWGYEMPLLTRLLRIIGYSVADGQSQMLKLRILKDIAPEAITPNLAGRLVV